MGRRRRKSDGVFRGKAPELGKGANSPSGGSQGAAPLGQVRISRNTEGRIRPEYSVTEMQTCNHLPTPPHSFEQGTSRENACWRKRKDACTDGSRLLDTIRKRRTLPKNKGTQQEHPPKLGILPLHPIPRGKAAEYSTKLPQRHSEEREYFFRPPFWRMQSGTSRGICKAHIGKIPTFPK
jgi:hypothetical protein